MSGSIVVDEAGRLKAQIAALEQLLEVQEGEVQAQGGKLERLLADLRERSERLAASQEELREQREILQSILDSMADGVAVAAPDGKFLVFNPAAEQILGLKAIDTSPDQWSKEYGLFLTDQVTPRPTETLPLVRAMRGEAVDEDLLFVRHAGAPQGLWLSVNARPLTDGSGKLRGGVALFRDVTERVKAQEALDRSTRELARSNAALEQFAFGVSHDLQEPLRVIASYCDLLEKRYRGQLDDEAAPFFGHIGESVDRLQDLIRDLLAYARAGRGDEPRPTSAEEIIRQVVSNLAELIRTEKAEIRRGDLPWVLGRPAELTQLFQNLIGNAIKFRGSEAPRVEITCERRGSTAAFAVRDNGIGMELAEAGKIFEMFSRLHGREYPGTGIGLALCRKIVESLGGRIEVESKPGEGSTFRFELPLAESSRASRS